MAETFKFHPTTPLLPCPCGKQFQSGRMDDGTPCLIHTLPHCEKFEVLDVPEFLHWVNVMNGGHN